MAADGLVSGIGGLDKNYIAREGVEESSPGNLRSARNEERPDKQHRWMGRPPAQRRLPAAAPGREFPRHEVDCFPLQHAVSSAAAAVDAQRASARRDSAGAIRTETQHENHLPPAPSRRLPLRFPMPRLPTMSPLPPRKARQRRQLQLTATTKIANCSFAMPVEGAAETGGFSVITHVNDNRSQTVRKAIRSSCRTATATG